jgi:hypothetical protein
MPAISFPQMNSFPRDGPQIPLSFLTEEHLSLLAWEIMDVQVKHLR